MTIFTPVFIVFVFDLWSRKFIWQHWIKATLAIIGAAIIVYSEHVGIGFWKGIILMQLSNIFFALGQVYYKKLLERYKDIDQKSNYSIVFLGSVLVTSIFSLFTTDFLELAISSEQWLVLLYLGTIASGLGFFLWNYGVTKVEVGSIAILNNLKIPIGVAFAVIILNESIDYFQLVVGTLIIILALYIDNIKQMLEKK